MIIDIHSQNCTKCKMRNQFYAEFNSDCKKNVSYLGLISYINYYIFMNLSEESKELSGKGQNLCILQLQNEWSVREEIQKCTDQEKNFIGQYFKGDNEQLWTSFKKKAGPKMPLYSPEHMGNLITIKKSDSFTESSPDDTVSSNSLKTTKDVNKRKQKKKGPSKKKVVVKKSKLDTIKRLRFNWNILKSSGKYEDDLFYETKLKCLRLAGNKELNSEKDTIETPRWSLPVSPIEPSRSPSYKDCFSPAEFQSIRKEAEEYQYRRNKRRKRMRACKKEEDSMIDGDVGDIKMKQVQNEQDYTYKTLTAVSKILEEMGQKDCEEDDKDNYFTDEESEKI